MTYLLWHYLADTVARRPDAPAVAMADARMTYAELDQESDRVARALADRGIRRGDRVGICAPKSLRTVAALAGVSKSGAAYVPVDPAAPARRGGYILGECGVRALVTKGGAGTRTVS